MGCRQRLRFSLSLHHSLPLPSPLFFFVLVRDTTAKSSNNSKTKKRFMKNPSSNFLTLDMAVCYWVHTETEIALPLVIGMSIVQIVHALTLTEELPLPAK